jgi:DNA invertase Pin-like site-specific DNA recombinase
MAKKHPALQRAVIYARYSTEKQRKESTADQNRRCERVATREGLEVVAYFADPEITGGTAQRPEYQKMLQLVADGGAEFVIAEEVARLWRNRKEYGKISTSWEDAGVHILTDDGDDTCKPAGWEPITELVAGAEAYRKRASRRTYRGLEGLALAGKPTGGRAYGYIAENKERRIDEEQAQVVLWIYQRRAEGWSARRITRQLNADKVPAPGASWKRTADCDKNKSGEWRQSAIQGSVTHGTGILNNPLYKGIVRWNRVHWKRSAEDSLIRIPNVRDDAEWIVREAPELRIVPVELWEQVHKIQTAPNPRKEQMARGLRKSAGGRLRSAYWLGGILRCGHCGSNLVAYGARDYMCPTYNDGGSCANNLRFRRADADLAMWDLIRQELLHPDRIAAERQWLEAQLRQQEREEAKAQRSAAAGVDTRRIDAEIEALRKLAISPAAREAAIAELERERAEALAAAAGIGQEKVSRARQLLDRLPEFADSYKKHLQTALDVLASPAHVEEARNATKALIDNGYIELRPAADHRAVEGPVNLLGLGSHVLQLAGAPRALRQQAVNNRGSGGSIFPLLVVPRSVSPQSRLRE